MRPGDTTVAQQTKLALAANLDPTGMAEAHLTSVCARVYKTILKEKRYVCSLVFPETF